MQTEIENVKNFTIAFFNNLKCDIKWNGDILEISNVPVSFETFYGKKSPYSLVFDRPIDNENVELITKGSFLIKAMAGFLENRGQTTLLRINYSTSLKEDIKKNYPLKNCDLFILEEKKMYDYIVRFGFLTTFQYLNEKEQVMNNIYVKGLEVINFDPSLYEIIDGNKKEVDVKDVKNEYSLAKDKVKNILQDKIVKISEELSERLNKEKLRINAHYENEVREIDTHIKKNKEQIIESEKEYTKTNDSTLLIKIAKIKENLKKLESPEARDKLEKEKQFFINDEINKHALNLDNKLLNTSVIYYPIYNIKYMFRNPGAGSKQFEVSDDILNNTKVGFKCESCEKDLREISICSSGHLSCFYCLRKCLSCDEEFCKLCKTETCWQCNKEICKKCFSKCYKCGKFFCKSHKHKC